MVFFSFFGKSKSTSKSGPTTSEIGGKVFFDEDQDGLKDSDESGIQDVTVTLQGAGSDGHFGNSDDTFQTQTTDANGEYTFSDLSFGKYQVFFTDTPDGLEFTFPDVFNASKPETDSDVTDFATGGTDVISLSSTQLVDVDAGLKTAKNEALLGENLLVNGSFEDPEVDNDHIDFLPDSEVAGWSSWKGEKLEIWDSGRNGVESSDGTNHLELDKDSTHGEGKDGIYQDIQTEAGQKYCLSFDIRARGDHFNTDDEAVVVEWNGVKTKIDGYHAVTKGEWTTITLEVEGTGGLDRLLLRESVAHGASDSTGPFLDNIKLREVLDPADLEDSDGDGIPNITDLDDDNDGLSDVEEADLGTDPLNPDTDGDGITDGVEVGETEGTPDSFGGPNPFVPDADPTSTTDPLDQDSDDDGLTDGEEDANADGETVNTIGGTGTDGSGETDPNNPDTDGDLLEDGQEVNDIGTSPLDTDTDDGTVDDGTEVLDQGTEPVSTPEDDILDDFDGDGIPDVDDLDDDNDGLSDVEEADLGTDSLNPDTDGDGIQDGTEVGETEGTPDSVGGDLTFVPDADPSTTTDPLDQDSDDDGLLDGEEDANADGETVNTIGGTGTDGSGETDPNNPDTDGDLLEDGQEVNDIGTSPLDTDTDDGTVDDGTEVLDQGTEPVSTPEDDVIPTTGKVGNQVFFDENGNGLQDAGEEGVEGVSLTLNGAGDDGVFGTADDTTDTRITNNKGRYTFTDVEPGDYTVTFDLPAGFAFTTANVGNNDNLDSDADQVTGTTELFSLAAGAQTFNVDAGLVTAVEDDFDGDGKPDSTDLDDDNDGLSDLEEIDLGTDPFNPDSDNDGIQDGTEVGETEGTPDSVGGDLTFVPDADPTTTTDPLDQDSDDDGLMDGEEDANADGETVNTIGGTGTDGSGETDPNNPDTDGDGLSDGAEVIDIGTSPLDTDTDDGTVDDGTEVLDQGTEPISTPSDDVIVPSKGSISGQVRNDADGDGDLSDDDAGIGGVTIKLYEDNDGVFGPDGPAIATAVTDENGNYTFGDLDEGKYVIDEINLPGFVSTADVNGFNPDRIAGVRIVGDRNVTGRDFLDAPGNGKPDALDDSASTPENTPVSIDVLENDTDPDSDMLTIDQIEAAPLNGSAEIVDGEIVYTPNAGFTGDDVFEYSVTDGQGGSDTATVEVSVIGKPEGSISGQVRNDADADGDLSDADAGIGGVTLKIYEDNDGIFGPDGDAIATVMTDANGNYTFDGLSEGKYIVDQVNLPGFVSTADANGFSPDRIAGLRIVGNRSITGRDFLDAPILEEKEDILGTIGDDDLHGTSEDDNIFGGAGNDKLVGLAGDDCLFGDAGNDRLVGGNGNDVLSGTNSLLQGVGEKDVLFGGNGSDTFILGDETHAFYAGAGKGDFAWVADFNPAEDTVQLWGVPELYETQVVKGHTQLFCKTGDGQPSELVAYFANNTNIDINSSAFEYV